jgi:hypothetical protein
VCDYVSTLRKIQRGELLAARRWIHHQLLETLFRLIHELRLRRGLPSLPDARRIEFINEPLVRDLSIDVLLVRESLLVATEKMAVLCRDILRALVADRWLWPDLSAMGLPVT